MSMSNALSTHNFALSDEAATQRLAQACAQAAATLLMQHRTGLSLHLQGNLGAGKTTFVRHLLRSLGVAGRIKSPTYGLAESYEITQSLTAWHFDFYRLESDKEFKEAGFAELWAAPVLRLVEWPEHAAPALPAPDVGLQLQSHPHQEHARSADLQALSLLGQAWLAAIAAIMHT
jgi:tRNA threonylcarbamoyladenosine biosynthesis protein TsaE